MSTLHFMQLEAMVFGQRKTNLYKHLQKKFSELILSPFPVSKVLCIFVSPNILLYNAYKKEHSFGSKKTQTAKTSCKMFQLHLTK